MNAELLASKTKMIAERAAKMLSNESTEEQIVIAERASTIMEVLPQVTEEKAIELAVLPQEELLMEVERLKVDIPEPKSFKQIENDISIELESIKQDIPEVLTTVVDTESEQTTLPKSVESIPEEPEKQFDFYVWLYDIFN